MNEEDQPASLADQAAAWIPPWQRPAAPATPPAGGDEDDADEIQRPETDVAEETPQDPPTIATEIVATDPEVQDPGDFTDVVGSEVHDPDNFTDVVGLDVQDPDNFTDVVGLDVQDPGNFTEVAVSEADEPDDLSAEVAESETDGLDDVTEVAELASDDPDDVAAEFAGTVIQDPDDFRAVVAGLLEQDPGDVPTEVAAAAVAAAGRTPHSVEAERPDNLSGALEAILLVVDEPVSVEVLAEVLAVSVDEANAALAALAREYTEQGRGFDLRRAAGGWRLYTRSEFASYVERFVLDGQSIRLTQAALETLAVIAYSQPVTRSRMSAIRGVNCDGVVRTLANRGLIEECGTQPDSGAFLYRTTDLFLEKLGLDSLVELPPLAPFLPDDVNGFADA